METIKIIATFIALFMIGCGSIPGPVANESSENVEIVTEPIDDSIKMSIIGFTDEEQAVIETAAAEHCNMTGECITFVDEADANMQFTVVEHTCSGGNFATTCKDANNKVYAVQMIPKRDRADWLTVLYYGALHEFGHVLGCWQHIPGANQMSSNWNELPGFLTDTDIACIKANGL
jgi:hypothetical protein